MPESVLLEVQEELLDWNGLGLSVMEISHRSPEFVEIAKQAESDFRDLLSISDNFAVLFTHGGATMQNAMVPLNLAAPDGVASYVNSGHWAKRSIKEAGRYTNVKIAASSEEAREGQGGRGPPEVEGLHLGVGLYQGGSGKSKRGL